MSETATPRLNLRFPQRQSDDIEQDVECVEVELDGEWRRIRFHDYHDIYDIPGLYEQLFYDELECDSPKVVCEALADQLRVRDLEPGDVRVLDVGAGNGMAGERLRAIGVDTIVGVDIIQEAADAAERDRPGAYDDYLVADLTALTPEQDAALADRRFNCLVTVAALGFGDMPPDAFAVAFNHVARGGLIARTIKEDFLAAGDDTGFAGLIRRSISDGAIDVLSQRRYRHRLSVTGEELFYVAVVAEKVRDVPVRSSMR